MLNDDVRFASLSVEKFLQSTPKAVRFFLDWHTACSGCGFARFCTMKDVATSYNLDGKKFLQEAEELISQRNPKGE
jgi:succinylglutamate desuccinylase